MRKSLYIIIVFLLGLIACQPNLTKWDLDKVEIINFETTEQSFNNLFIDNNQQVGFQQLDTFNYVSVLQDQGSIKQIIYSPFRMEDTITLEANIFPLTDGLACNDLIKKGDTLYAAIQGDHSFKIEKYSMENDEDDENNGRKKLVLNSESSNIREFVQEKYNQVDSIICNDLTFNHDASEIWTTGHVVSFDRRWSFVMGFDVNQLQPKWIRVHLQSATGMGIDTISNNRFIIIGQKSNIGFLIVDNIQGEGFHKIELNNVSSFNALDVDVVNDEVFASITLDDRSTRFKYKFNDVDTLEPRFGMDLFKSSSEIGLSLIDKYGGVVSASNNLNRNSIAITRTVPFNYNKNWCNQFSESGVNNDPFKVLGLIEDIDIGFVIFAIAENSQGRFYPVLIKTDQEGATRENKFNENACN